MFSQSIKLSSIALAAVTMLGTAAMLSAQAADAVATTSTATQPDPAQVDRDGKRICGYELMSESERGGHRAMLHMAKAMEDRDAIRTEQCKVMHKRAQERGVELKE